MSEQEVKVQFKPPFVVQLADDASIKPAAAEAASGFKGDAVLVELDGTRVHFVEQQNGRFEIGSEVVTKAVVVGARHDVPHFNPVVWQAQGLGAQLQPGVPANVQLDTRLRFSFFDFNTSFIKGGELEKVQDKDGTTVVLIDQFAALFDDYTLVETIGFTSAKGGDADPPNWRGFAPGGDFSDAACTKYLKKLCDEMHARNRHVIAGYEMVLPLKKGTPEKPLTPEDEAHNAKTRAYRDSFLQWLNQASPDQVRAHVGQMRDFFISRSIEVDGIAYDFEMDSLGSLDDDPKKRKPNFPNHATNLAVLFTETAQTLGAGKGFGCVYYTGPFLTKDGGKDRSNMSVLKFSLAAGLPIPPGADPADPAKPVGNMIPRPMCFDGKSVTKADDMAASIQIALGKVADGGGGLHPSQLQFALNPGMIGFDNLTAEINDIFRPNRVGIAVFKPKDRPLHDFLTAAAAWNKALNPKTPPGTSGQPLQVPIP
ncbi:MAG: hypothetical protein ACXWLM_11475 [Myxococcales bacterium]